MHMVFLILKIAGISVISLLALLIFLLILLLFVPFCYQLYGKIPMSAETEEHGTFKKAEGRVTIHFLFFLLRFVLEYREEKVTTMFRILGISILGRKKKNKKNDGTASSKQRSDDSIKKQKKDGKNRTDKKEAKAVENDNGTEDVKNAKDKENAKKKEDSAGGNKKETKAEPDKHDESLEQYNESQENRKKKRFRSKAVSFFEMIRNLPKRLHERKERIRSSFKNIRTLWHNKHIHNGIAKIWKELKFLLFKLKPKKIKGYVHLGFDDPSLTGKLLGVLSIVYPLYGDNLKVEPDFERQIFHGELTIKGRLPLYILLGIVWRLYRDREVRYVYKKLNK